MKKLLREHVRIFVVHERLNRILGFYTTWIGGLGG